MMRVEFKLQMTITDADMLLRKGKMAAIDNGIEEDDWDETINRHTLPERLSMCLREAIGFPPGMGALDFGCEIFDGTVEFVHPTADQIVAATQGAEPPRPSSPAQDVTP